MTSTHNSVCRALDLGYTIWYSALEYKNTLHLWFFRSSITFLRNMMYWLNILIPGTTGDWCCSLLCDGLKIGIGPSISVTTFSSVKRSHLMAGVCPEFIHSNLNITPWTFRSPGSASGGGGKEGGVVVLPLAPPSAP